MIASHTTPHPYKGLAQPKAEGEDPQMPLSPILCQRRERLVAALRLAVAHGVLSAWRRCERLATTPQEADLVAGIVVEGTPLIRWAMQYALHPAPISVSICAVFCHQAPIVAFGPDPRESCELGDILFAFVHSPRHGPIRRNALLFQAKASAQRPHRLRPDDAAQLRLYREWPDFEYSRASSLTGQWRSVTPREPHAGAQYLLIDDTPPASPTCGLLGPSGPNRVETCMPNERLWGREHLAAELFGLLTCRSGRPFDDRVSSLARHDWSRVVWDLIEIGLRKAFTRRNSGWTREPRFSGETAFDLDGRSFARTSSPHSSRTAAEILGRDGVRLLYEDPGDFPPSNVARIPERREPEEGVSVVLIETSEGTGNE